MSQTEQLNIVVSEKGSKGVADLLRSIAAEARAAGSAVKRLRRQVGTKGGGSASEAKRKNNGVDEVARAEKAKLALVAKAEKDKQALKERAERAHIRLTRKSLADAEKAANAKTAATNRWLNTKIKADTSSAASSMKEANKVIAEAEKVSNVKKAATLKWFNSHVKASTSAAASSMKEANRIKAEAEKAANAKTVATNRWFEAHVKASTSAAASSMKEANRVKVEAERAANAKKKATASWFEAHVRASTKAAAREIRTTNVILQNQAKIRSSYNRSAGSVGRYSLSMRNLEKAVQRNTIGLRGLGNQVFFVQRAFAALGGVFAIRGFLSMSDAYQNMENRIGLVTETTEEFNDVQKKLQDISRETRQSLTATVETYVRLRLATRHTGVSQERLMGVLTTLNQMLAVSGATATEAEQSIRQLSQAFSKGKLDGDEFRSVSEAMPAILTALEKSLGKTRGELRDMSEAGQLTTKVLVEAFEANKKAAADDFGKSIVTIGQAWAVLKNEVLEAVGAFNSSTGAIGLMVKLTMGLAQNLWIVEAALQALAAYGFIKLIAGLKTLTLYLITTAIPTMLAYGTAVRTAQTADFIGPLTKGGGISKATKGLAALADGGGVFSFLARGAKQLVNAVGRLGPVAAVAGAAFAGWKIGSFVADITGITEETKKIQLNASAIAMDMAGQAMAFEEIKLKEAARLRHQAKYDSAKKENLLLMADELEMQAKILHNQYLGFIQESILADAKMEQAIADKKHYDEVQAPAAEKMAEMVAHLKKAENVQTSLTKQLRDFVNLAITAGANSDTIFDTLAELEGQSLHGEKIAEQEAELEILRIKGTKAQEIARIEQEVNGRYKDRLKFAHAELVLKEALIATTGFGDTKEQTQELSDLNRERQKEIDNAKEIARLRAKNSAGSKKKQKEDPLLGNLQNLLANLNPQLAAQNELDEGTKILTDSMKRFGLGQEWLDKKVVQLKKSLEDQLDPLQALHKRSQDLAHTTNMGTQELADYNEMIAMRTELASADTSLTDKQIEQEVALWQARKKTFDQDQLRISAVEGVTNSLDSAAKAADTYAIALEGIQAASDLTAMEAHRAELAALQALYPSIADELYDLDRGIIGMTEDQKKLVDLEDLEKTKLIQLNQARAAGRISLDQYQAGVMKVSEETRKLTQEMNAQIIAGGYLKGVLSQVTETAVYEQQVAAITNAFNSIETVAVETTQHLSEVFDNVLSGAEDPWENFASNMKDTFRNMVDAILEELTRLIIRMTVAAALKETLEGGSGIGSGAPANFGTASPTNYFSGTLQNPLSGFRHGGTLNAAELPRFANGGSMQVGGQGGPDSKLVQFMASPGENVKVTNPGQSRLDNKKEPRAAPQVNINNVIDPSQMAAAMASPSGRKAILNVIQQDGGTIRRLLG